MGEREERKGQSGQEGELNSLKKNFETNLDWVDICPHFHDAISHTIIDTHIDLRFIRASRRSLINPNAANKYKNTSKAESTINNLATQLKGH